MRGIGRSFLKGFLIGVLCLCIVGLAGLFVPRPSPPAAGADALEPVFAARWRAASDDGVRLRAVIDQVAALTDVSASTWHARWCGMLSSQL